MADFLYFRSKNQNFTPMSFIRALLCVLFPPLSVLDKGCGSILLVSVLTVAGYIPGIICAVLICTRKINP